MKINCSLSLAAAAALFLPGPVASHALQPEIPAPPTPSSDGWWFHSNSYGWLTAQSGDMHIANLTVPVKVGLDDAIAGIDELDMGFMGGLDFGRGRWSLGTDLTYMKASDSFPSSSAAFKSFGLEQSQWMINPFVSCQLLRSPHWQLDAIAGARINIFEMDVTGRFTTKEQVTIGGSRTWTDPIVGLRTRWDASDRLSFGIRGDIGGFGAASDLTWQAYAGLGWQITPRSIFALGYRALGTDYHSRNYGTDIVSHGPLIGLQFGF